MREFSVELGGKVRALKFHTLDALELKKRFDDGARRLIFEKCLGIPSEPNPDGRFKASVYLMDQEVQLFVLYLALRRGGSKVTESQLIEFVDEYTQPPSAKDFGELAVTAAKAALYSGAITGHSVDLDAGPEEGDAGKGASDSSGTT